MSIEFGEERFANSAGSTLTTPSCAWLTWTSADSSESNGVYIVGLDIASDSDDYSAVVVGERIGEILHVRGVRTTADPRFAETWQDLTQRNSVTINLEMEDWDGVMDQFFGGDMAIGDEHSVTFDEPAYELCWQCEMFPSDTGVGLCMRCLDEIKRRACD